MIPDAPGNRVYLFLQGPHGPFFNALARHIGATGGTVWRVGFNAGDRAFWPDRRSYVPYRGTDSDWPASCAALLDRYRVSDIVLYGDTRPVHAHAIAAARDRGLRVHVFEEGYMRPYWVSYERDGSNGHSRLMQLSIADMQAALARSDPEAPLPPASWGDMREHVFYGALYHFCVMFLNRGYRRFVPHRNLTVAEEFRLYLKRLVLMPAHSVERRIATRRIRRSGFAYHLALLQLDHDASFRDHSPFASTTEFIDQVIAGFAAGAPGHHHLVFKAHPLEDGRVPIRREIRGMARRHGVGDRVHFVRGGKLARLLDEARSAVTVNSTAAQQVLWRGMPLKALGQAVYSKPELVSGQELAAFFADPQRPDIRACRDFRRFLLETSQVPGGFYSARGRRRLLRHVTDMMLCDHDPYSALMSGTAAPRQQFHVIG